MMTIKWGGKEHLAFLNRNRSEAMTELEINQIIHEAMGLKWHKLWFGYGADGEDYIGGCSSCGIDFMSDEALEKREGPTQHQSPDYTRWKHYGPMLEWFKADEERWELFLREQSEKFPVDDDGSWDYPKMTGEIVLNPLRGSTAIAEFWKERKP